MIMHSSRGPALGCFSGLCFTPRPHCVWLGSGSFPHRCGNIQKMNLFETFRSSAETRRREFSHGTCVETLQDSTAVETSHHIPACVPIVTAEYTQMSHEQSKGARQFSITMKPYLFVKCLAFGIFSSCWKKTGSYPCNTCQQERKQRIE